MAVDWSKLELDDSGRATAADALPGIRLQPLPEEAQDAEFVFALIKYRDDEGETSWCYRTSRAPNPEELLGALRLQTLLLERDLTEEWPPGGADDEEEVEMTSKHQIANPDGEHSTKD